MDYQVDFPRILNTRLFVQAFGDPSTTLEEAIHTTVKWYHHNRS